MIQEEKTLISSSVEDDSKFSLDKEKKKSATSASPVNSDKNDISVINNHVFFYSDVTRENVVKFIKKTNEIRVDLLRKISMSELSKDRAEIHVHIFSPGGKLNAGLLLYDYVSNLKKEFPVLTHIEGQVSSAATLLSIAGTKRFITPSSFMMIHELSSSIFGTMTNIQNQYDNLQKMEKHYIDIYLKHSNFTEENLRDLLKKDLYLTSIEALNHGLVDEINLNFF